MPNYTRVRYIQYRDAALGWCDYIWGDGLRGAKYTYRHVRVVDKYQGADGFFDNDQQETIRIYTDGVRIK